jgi:group I intron endonuclease
MDKSGIYKITNPEGKVYIGCSKNMEYRKNLYKNYRVSTQKLIYESLIKYGWGNHIWEEIEYTFDLKEREKYWINEYDSFKDGLNSNVGGGGPLSHTNETRKIISIKGKANKGKRVTSHRKGKKLEDNHKLNNKANKGKRVNSHWKGKTRSEENKLNLSLAKKGIPNPKNSKIVLQYDLKGNFIKEWSSIKCANLFLRKDKDSSSIGECCRGKKQTAYGFKWKYKN